MARALKVAARGDKAADAAGLTLASVRQDLPRLDRLIHERLRLGIVSALAASAELTFSDLKELLDTTDGNLSVHARKLEEAGYVVCEKTFQGRLPKSVYRLTPRGRRAFELYLDHMEALVRAMRGDGA